jgi:Ca2+-binding RTX toxin-like protein
LNGTDNVDFIFGGSGNDFINGNAGNDVIYGGVGNDTINGEAGDDLIEGGDGNDTISSNSGSDILRGGSGNDNIDVTQRIGGLRADTVIESGIGDDLVILNRDGIGSDIVDLGEGEDKFIFVATATGVPAKVTLGGGRDIVEFRNIDFFDDINGPTSSSLNITDFQVGPRGDAFDFSYIYDGLRLARNAGLSGWDGSSNPFGSSGFFRLVQSGADTLVQVDFDGTANRYGFVNLATLQNVTASQLDDSNFGGFHPDGRPAIGQIFDGTALNDVIAGTAGGDTINGYEGMDLISGDSGNDFINGGAGNDIIDGGAGNDIIDGGDGDDHLTSYIGSDTLIGGAGNDYIDATHRTRGIEYNVVIDAGTGNDTVGLRRT